MKFSIVTPSFNQVDFIEETIQSVLSQKNTLDGHELEYWVIDGGSTDGTLEILKKYAIKHKNFFYLSETDRGQSHAINKGIQKSTGNIIAYLNSDDTYLPETLKKVASYTEKHPKVKWFYGRSIIVNENGEPIKPLFTWMKNFLGKRYAYWKLLSTNIISQPAVFLRKDIFEQYGYFNEGYHLVMDYEYWLRIGKKNPPLPIHENLSRFRVHTQSKTSINIVEIYWSEFKVSLTFLPPYFWPCVFIHLLNFIIAVVWMQFKKL